MFVVRKQETTTTIIMNSNKVQKLSSCTELRRHVGWERSNERARERGVEGREMLERVCGGGCRLAALKYFLSQKRDLLTDCQWRLHDYEG